tara:strand:- start:944 stop:1183 length:240 start_codon:yes stop_codon:yes gene_type:complete
LGNISIFQISQSFNGGIASTTPVSGSAGLFEAIQIYTSVAATLMIIVAKAIVLIKVGFENQEVRLDQSEHIDKAYDLNS